MKLLSQQIREIVEKSPSSSYAIAKAAGIEKSAMSRFMNGGRLTMDKLDQLARVFGLVVTPEVSSVPLPLEKGRPNSKTKDQKMMMKERQIFSKTQAYDVAVQVAEKAVAEYFSDRRGVLNLQSIGVLAVYNNNPFHDPTIRPREISRLTERLAAIGISVLAQGYAGEKLKNLEEKYSTALVLDCGEDRMSEVIEIVDQCGGEANDENRRSPIKGFRS